MLRFKSFLLERAVYAGLKHNDLTKRGGARVDVFLDKIKDGEEFLTTKGLIKLDKDQMKDLDVEMRKGGFSKTLKAGSKTVKYPSEFFKTPEFGGKGVGFGTQAEDRELSKLRTGIEDAMQKDGVSFLPMKVGNRIVKVVGVTSTAGTPKSDFHLVDGDNNAVAWISHKDGSKPSDFQQYGGLSARVFAGNAEVQKFMKDLKKMFPDGLTTGTSVFRIAKDQNVIRQSVWGVDWKSKTSPRGKNNVDEFHQGAMTVKKSGSNYIITSNHSDTNGSIPKDRGYEAIYFARYTSDRGARVAGEFVGNARVGVFPRAKAGNTSKEI